MNVGLPSQMSNLLSEKDNLFRHVKIEHLIAGVTGGVASTLILHPLDLVKIRFAVNDGRVVGAPQYKGLTDAFFTIVRVSGVRGLYQGALPNVVGAGASWGLYFFFYNAIKGWMLRNNEEGSLAAGYHMLAAAESGILTLTLTNPIWVAKTRLILQYKELSNIPDHKQYRGFLDALYKVSKYEGIRGLYKGYIPGIFGVSHGALQFMTYEEMKKYYHKYNNTPTTKKLTTLEYLSFAALSKVIAASCTYPYQVVRARLQDQHHNYAGILEVITKTFKFEGFKGFYKGLLPNILRVTPATAITFLVYENLVDYLRE